MISSEMFCTPSMSCNVCWMTCWYFFGPDDITNISLLYLYRPWCVMSVVIPRDSSDNSIWWYPNLKSNLLNTLLRLMSWSTLSMVGMGCLSRSTVPSLASYPGKVSPPLVGSWNNHDRTESWRRDVNFLNDIHAFQMIQLLFNLVS